jgi:hypothetical protein
MNGSGLGAYRLRKAELAYGIAKIFHNLRYLSAE